MHVENGWSLKVRFPTTTSAHRARPVSWIGPALAGTLVMLAVAFTSCGGDAETSAPGAGNGEGRLAVYTTFYPTWFFVKTIGGSSVNAVNPIPPDEDPIFFQPPAEMVLEYQQKADMIVLNGAGYARWVAKVMLPEEKVVNAGAAFEHDLIEIEAATTHSHGEQGEHTHEGIDGHTWIDPQLAMEQCRAIAAALEAQAPEHAQDFTSRLEALLAGLQDLDDRLRALQEKGLEVPVVASHPAYNYLCRRYGWTVVSFDFDPQSLPAGPELEKLKAHVDAHPGTRYMVWEEMPCAATAQAIRETCGLEPIEFAPVETPPGKDLDYLEIMQRNIENLTPLFE